MSAYDKGLVAKRPCTLANFLDVDDGHGCVSPESAGFDTSRRRPVSVVSAS